MNDAPYQIEEVSISHVVLVAAGQYNLNVDPNRLVQVFGRFGAGTFSQAPNGFVVQMGPANQFIMQLPRIEFKTANEDIMLEAFAHALPLLTPTFEGHPSAAFGLNLEWTVGFPGLGGEEALRRLSGGQPLPGMRVTNLGLSGPAGTGHDFNCQLRPHPQQAHLLLVHTNKHMPNPGPAFWDAPALKEALATARRENETFLRDMWEALQVRN